MNASEPLIDGRYSDGHYIIGRRWPKLTFPADSHPIPAARRGFQTAQTAITAYTLFVLILIGLVVGGCTGLGTAAGTIAGAPGSAPSSVASPAASYRCPPPALTSPGCCDNNGARCTTKTAAN